MRAPGGGILLGFVQSSPDQVTFAQTYRGLLKSVCLKLPLPGRGPPDRAFSGASPAFADKSANAGEVGGDLLANRVAGEGGPCNDSQHRSG
jgi:hypothetical protein